MEDRSLERLGEQPDAEHRHEGELKSRAVELRRLVEQHEDQRKRQTGGKVRPAAEEERAADDRAHDGRALHARPEPGQDGVEQHHAQHDDRGNRVPHAAGHQHPPAEGRKQPHVQPADSEKVHRAGLLEHPLLVRGQRIPVSQDETLEDTCRPRRDALVNTRRDAALQRKDPSHRQPRAPGVHGADRLERPDSGPPGNAFPREVRRVVELAGVLRRLYPTGAEREFQGIAVREVARRPFAEDAQPAAERNPSVSVADGGDAQKKIGAHAALFARSSGRIESFLGHARDGPAHADDPRLDREHGGKPGAGVLGRPQDRVGGAGDDYEGER